MLDQETKNELTSIKKIVFATDLLESSRLALDYAVAFACHYRATLTIVHAFELSAEAQEAEMIGHRPSVSRERMFSRLKALATGVSRLGISTEVEPREGEPCAAVLSSASENRADMLVLGTHGIYRGLEHVLMGSNAEKILLSAPCPTLTVGGHVLAGVDVNLNFRKILVVSEGTPESEAAFRYAASLGRDLGLESEVLTISRDGFATDSQRVLECAMTCSDSLLILGVRKESAWKRHLHASFAFELVAKSVCPVLSIHER